MSSAKLYNRTIIFLESKSDCWRVQTICKAELLLAIRHIIRIHYISCVVLCFTHSCCMCVYTCINFAFSCDAKIRGQPDPRKRTHFRDKRGRLYQSHSEFVTLLESEINVCKPELERCKSIISRNKLQIINEKETFSPKSLTIIFDGKVKIYDYWHSKSLVYSY